MRMHRKLLFAVVVTGTVLVGLPVIATSALYVRSLGEIGELPRPPTKPLPELGRSRRTPAAGQITRTSRRLEVALGPPRAADQITRTS